jgi:hypothetical protein
MILHGTGQREVIRNTVRPQKQAKGFLQGPSVSRIKELLKLNRNQMWWMTALHTAHCQLKRDSFKIGWD